MSDSRTKPHTILWIDDATELEALVRQRLRKRQEAEGLDISFVASLEAARAHLATLETWPLLLCDIDLPDGSGIAFLQEISQRKGKDATVIMVTALDDLALIRQSMQSGAFDFLTKPLDFDDLLLTINRGLEHQRQRRRQAREARKLRQMEYQLEVAKKIQTGLLKPVDPRVNLGPNIDAAASYVAPARLGGVFFEYRVLDRHRHMIFMASVSDPSLGGSLYLTSTQAILSTILLSSPVDSAAQVLATLNHVLYHNNPTGHFITCFLGILSPNKGSLSYASAGQRPPLILTPDGTMEVMENQTDVPLGLSHELEFNDHWYFLKPGETLLVQSHGASELKSADGGITGDAGFRTMAVEAIKAAGGKGARGFLDHLERRLKGWSGDQNPHDDLALLAVKYTMESLDDGGENPAVQGH